MDDILELKKSLPIFVKLRKDYDKLDFSDLHLVKVLHPNSMYICTDIMTHKYNGKVYLKIFGFEDVYHIELFERVMFSPN